MSWKSGRILILLLLCPLVFLFMAYQLYFPYGIHEHSPYRQTSYNAALVARALKQYSLDNEGFFPPPPEEAARQALIAGGYCSESDFKSLNPAGGRLMLGAVILGKAYSDQALKPSDFLVQDEFGWNGQPPIRKVVGQLKY